MGNSTSVRSFEDFPDLTGKVAIVTGATSGIGYATTQLLLRKGATVYLATRSESKTTGVIARLESEGLGPGNGKPIWHKLVLDDPRDAKKSAEDFLARESRLDILVNNAALLLKVYEVGPVGISDVTTVNHLSPFLFTETLLPLLKRTALLPGSDVRIVNVSSMGHFHISDVKFETKDDLNGPTKDNGMLPEGKRYGFTKLLNILWTRELQHRLNKSQEDGGSNIICLSLHPGTLATEGNFAHASRYSWPISTIYRWLITLAFGKTENGAYVVLVAAASREVREQADKYRGAYLDPPGKLVDPSKTAQDDSLAKNLWELTENVLGEYGV